MTYFVQIIDFEQKYDSYYIFSDNETYNGNYLTYNGISIFVFGNNTYNFQSVLM